MITLKVALFWIFKPDNSINMVIKIDITSIKFLT